MRFKKLITLMNYPIISHEKSDDIKGNVELDIVQESIEELDKNYKIPFSLEIASDFIKKQVMGGNIGLSIAVNCQDTYFFSNEDISFVEHGFLKISKDELFGTVYFTAVGRILTDDFNVPSDQLMGDYKAANVVLKKGTIFAVSNEIKLYISEDQKPLDPSIFKLAEDDEIDEKSFWVDLTEHEHVNIRAGKELYNKISDNRSRGNKRATLLNMSGIYFPAIISLFEQIAQKGHGHRNKSWFRAITNALEPEDRELLVETDAEEAIDPLELAQKLLDHPFLKATKEIIEDDQ